MKEAGKNETLKCFSGYGIFISAFSDEHLGNIDGGCFKQIQHYFERPAHTGQSTAVEERKIHAGIALPSGDIRHPLFCGYCNSSDPVPTNLHLELLGRMLRVARKWKLIKEVPKNAKAREIPLSWDAVEALRVQRRSGLGTGGSS